MTAGRPTKYTAELLEAARSYVDGGYAEQGDPAPLIAGLAINLGISRETVYAWASQDDKGEFSDIVSDLMATQERKLLQGGLSGEFNASITKLALTKHDYSDKSENTLQGGDKPISVQAQWVVTPVKVADRGNG